MRDSELIERFVLLSWKELVERKRSLMVVCGKSSEEGEEKKWGGGGGGEILCGGKRHRSNRTDSVWGLGLFARRSGCDLSSLL
jgi:hypothetical protein